MVISFTASHLQSFCLYFLVKVQKGAKENPVDVFCHTFESVVQYLNISVGKTILIGQKKGIWK
jgi:hypothetical protein